MRNRSFFFSIAYVWEENDHMSSTVFFPIGCRWTRPIWSPTVAIARVAGNHQLSIEMNGIVTLCRCMSLVVWTGVNEEAKWPWPLESVASVSITLQIRGVRFTCTAPTRSPLLHIYTCIYIHIYIYIYMCVCVVCMYLYICVYMLKYWC